MKRLLPIAVLLCAQCAFAQDSSKEQLREYPDGVAAVVEGSPVTEHELELVCSLRSDFRRMPEGAERQAIRDLELEELIKQRILLQRAEEEKIVFTEADQKRLDWEFERMAQDRRGVDGLKADLEALGIPFSFFASRKRTSLVVFKLLSKTISRDIFITPAEIRSDYDLNKVQWFMRSGELRLARIVIYPKAKLRRAFRAEPPGIKQYVAKRRYDAKALAERARARVLAGEPFGDVARDCSMGSFFDRPISTTDDQLYDVLPRSLAQRVRTLQVGELSEVIEAENGSFNLVYLIHRTERGPLPLEEVQDKIESRLKSMIWRSRVDAFIREAREAAFVRKYPRRR